MSLMVRLKSLNALASSAVYDYASSKISFKCSPLRDQIYLFGRIGSQSVERHYSRMMECYDVRSNNWVGAHSSRHV